MSNKRQNLCGRRYGRGVVTRRLGKDKWHCFVWELECDCGNTYTATTGNLNSKHVVSCGCYNKEVVAKNARLATKSVQLPKGHAARNELYKSYRVRAKQKELAFELTKAEFLALTKQNCFYCGIEPSTVYRAGSGDYVYNGVDRIDSSEGYTLQNSVACCKRCNQGKNDMSWVEFMSWISRVYEHGTINLLKELTHVP